MLEEAPEGVPDPGHPKAQDCHREGAQGGLRGLLSQGKSSATWQRSQTFLWF